MRNIKLTIEYEGTGYEGWQVQNPAASGPRRRTVKTVQAAVERALRRILREKVSLCGSGRTDTGVHARAQEAGFLTASRIPAVGLQKALNSVLPEDISVTGVRDMPLGFHCRFSAKWKLYRYTILNRPSPSALRRNFVFFCNYPLDAGLMRREASALEGTHDFKSFHSADVKERNSIRTIRRITVAKKGEEIVIDVEADGFLKNMVRTIAGTLIEIGRGKLPAGSMRRILARRDRKAAGPTAPPQGLCLEKVWY